MQFIFTAHVLFHCNPEEQHYQYTKITAKNMPKLTGVAGAFAAAAAVEAPLDDALA